MGRWGGGEVGRWGGGEVGRWGGGEVGRWGGEESSKRLRSEKYRQSYFEMNLDFGQIS